jgi:hypothetical protein
MSTHIYNLLLSSVEAVGNRGALPRLPGREGLPPVEHCLACEAVVSKDTRAARL